MSKGSEMEEQQFIESLKVEIDRMDSACSDEYHPSFAAFESLACHTQLRMRRKRRKEFALFLMIAFLLVSGIFLTAWNRPGLLLLIHGLSMLAGAVVLTLDLRFRESRDRHE